MPKIRLMLVDDDEFLRLGVRAAFELESDIHIVGEASNGLEALAKISVLDPQVILMDVRMEKMGGIEACREIKNTHPDIAILMITSYPDDKAAIASAIAGASGYLIKNAGRAKLLKAVREIAVGKILLKPEDTEKARQCMTSLANGTQHTQGEELTEREREVLALVALGYTNKGIAETLSVSEKTARNHVSHILMKLGLARRSGAAAYAVKHELIPPHKQP